MNIPLRDKIKDMSMILEKSLGNMNTQKLRVILLLKVDFNVLCEITFNGRMMLVLEEKMRFPMKS